MGAVKKPKRSQKGNLVWRTDKANGSFVPAIIVKHAKNNKAIVNIFTVTGKVQKELVNLDMLAICTISPSSISFCNKGLEEACQDAYSAMEDQPRLEIKIEKHQVQEAFVRLEKLDVTPKSLNRTDKEVSVTIAKLTQQEISSWTKGRQEKAPVCEEAANKETPEEEEVDENVQQKIQESRKSFMDSLDLDNEMDDLSDKENENSKENDDNWEPKKITSWKPVIGGSRKPLQPVVMSPFRRKHEPKPDDLSEYEKLRLKNIEDQRSKFLEAMKSLSMGLKPTQKPFGKKPLIRRRKIVRKVYTTRASRRNSTCSSPTDTPSKQSWDYESDEEFTELGSKKRRTAPKMWIVDPNVDVLQPEDVTPKMMENIADAVSQKVYCQARGTTCHQCRQKTLDTKTICRSGHCVGGRGFFCGICLKNRYGEDIRKVLKDPNWWCPPCMDICNCSICRNRLGKGATGPLTWLAQEKGFNSVKEYLEHLTSTKGSDQFDDE